MPLLLGIVNSTTYSIKYYDVMSAEGHYNAPVFITFAHFLGKNSLVVL